MPLTCSCSSDYSWYFDPPDNYTVFPMAIRRERCSCGNLIEHGATCLKFKCYRLPRDDIESRIYGEDGEIPLAAEWLCERCADLYFSFYELGYECVAPGENMLELLKDYSGSHGQH